jgi:Lipase (class 3)
MRVPTVPSYPLCTPLWLAVTAVSIQCRPPPTAAVAWQAMVHSGFLGAYDAVRARVLRLLELILGGDRSGPWRVMVTGHSLGGALATICSYELATYL